MSPDKGCFIVSEYMAKGNLLKVLSSERDALDIKRLTKM